MSFVSSLIENKLDEAKEFVLNYIDEEIEYANNMNEAKWEDLKLGNL